ncbi:MAG: penicillin-binding transpeptidase domain-containing protein [Gammaproteobacteria bacterium]|nr:penicillin-binding transpeptidase domain-containing protein [Gammaproteobacteria bacterium]
MISLHSKSLNSARGWSVLFVLYAGFALLAARGVYLQLVATDYLQQQGKSRYLRDIEVAATRGMILDRNGQPLAVSTPVDSVWAQPQEFIEAKHHWPALASLLQMSMAQLSDLSKKYASREFMYIKRHIAPDLAEQVKALGIPGVGLMREYRRYYPAGPVTGHVVGFTNVDNQGQEGAELAFNTHLSGASGVKRVLRDRLGRVVERVERIQPAVDGKDLFITLDSRLQYLAYSHLKAAVREHKAHSASAVILNSRNGELLAMVNEPSFNPNARGSLKSSSFRNRAVTDVLEPGSTIKPFTIAMALDSQKYGPDTRVDTSPGLYRVGRHTIRDVHDYGLLTVSRVVSKSSNVGAAKIAMSLPPERLWQMLRNVGFGVATGSGLPGEVSGSHQVRSRWRPIEHATLAFGYGLSATPLQIARAFSCLASGGMLMPVTLLRGGSPSAKRVLPETVAHMVRDMLVEASSERGTGKAAMIAQYRIAGKTGTVHKSTSTGYAENRYSSVFAGFAPATDPRLVMVVVVDDPVGGKYYGGEVAAPVFARVMSGALRLLNVPPDAADGSTIDEYLRRLEQERQGVDA